MVATMIVAVVPWVILGITAGWLASAVVRTSSNRLIGNILVGIAGACAGGLLSVMLVGGPSFMQFTLTGLLGAIAGASSVGIWVILSGGRAKWRLRNVEAPVPASSQSDSAQSVQRLDLLSWRFSLPEIERLSTLQLRYREQPDSLDMPLDESRLRFARWLVEHGGIGEDDRSSRGKLTSDGQMSCESRLQDGLPRLPEDTGNRRSGTPATPAGEPTPESTRRKHHRSWCLPLRRAFSRAHLGIGGAAGAADRELENPEYLPGDGHHGDSSNPWEPWGLYGGSHSQSSPYWFWMGLRRGC
jgi:uncharacterized membrane protein YeaQ/YmgE (transglycosylase-associated protein family)